MKKRSQIGKPKYAGNQPGDGDGAVDKGRVSRPFAEDGEGGSNKFFTLRSLRLLSPFLGHGFFFVLGMVSVLFSQSLFSTPRRDSLQPSDIRPGSSKISAGGCLEYTTIELERPDDSLVAIPAYNSPIRWQFENLGEDRLGAFFRDLDVPESILKQLLDKSRWQVLASGIAVSPVEQTVMELSPSARKKIYGVLSRSTANFAQQNPIRIPAEKLEDWVKTSGLSGNNQRVFQKLLYPQGKDMLFSDYEVIAARCAPEERKRFAKAGSRVEAMVASLRITPETDIDALVGYWGRWTGGHHMVPFIQALSAVPGGTSINVSYLFPPFARLRLYTYPQTAANTPDLHEDCFWTAMNFFNEKPDNRFCDPKCILETLRNDYAVVTGERIFGDVLLITENGSKALHMCVHVADDVVFTKNGAHALQPWVLMRLPEMLRQYSGDALVQIRCYRRISK